MSGAVEGVALLETLIPKLRRMIDSGHRTLGGGTVSYDGRSSTWGNEPIMKLANPDGPDIAAAIESLIPSLTTPPARSYADGVEDAARIVSQKAQAISTKLGRGNVLDEVTLGIIAILTDAAADIRLLSQGGKA